MNVVIDSYGLLRAIGRHREAFASIDALVNKQALALLTAQLKHKSLDIELYRAIVAAIGIEPFELFLDIADDKLLKAIAKKIDPHAAVTKVGDGDEIRLHLVDLGTGRMKPAAKPGKAASRAKKAAGAGKGGVMDGPHAIATKPPGRR